MTDMQVAFWLVTIGIIEIVSVLVAIFVVFPSENNWHILLKIGFASMVFGLVVQIVRSSHYLTHGYYPIDIYFPMWIAKDIGASVLIYYFAFIHPRLMQNR